MQPPERLWFAVFSNIQTKGCVCVYATLLNLYQKVFLLTNRKRSTALSSQQQLIDSKFG